MSDRPELCRPPADPAASRAFFEAMAAGELPGVIRSGPENSDRRTDVICGFLGCDVHPFNPVLDALPSLVRVPADRAGTVHPWVEHAAAASRSARPGGRQALLRLSEWLFVELLRCCVDREGGAGWLGAIHHPTVGRVLRALHAEPSQSWTLEALARRCGLSRSRLTAAFTETVGIPPMQYLTRWRVQLAARQLVERDTKVEAVAADVGYRSVAAFSRAFKRVVGCSPGEYRRRWRTVGSAR